MSPTPLSLTIANAISKYLTTGMHHCTDIGKNDMANIIDRINRRDEYETIIKKIQADPWSNDGIGFPTPPTQ